MHSNFLQRPKAAVHAVAATLALLVAGHASAQVVVSQIYGGGGNSGATYNRKYVELFNQGNTAVNLSGLSLQYAAAAGTNWSQRTNLTGSIAPKGYFLIGLTSGGNGVALPLDPDQTGAWAPAAANGNVALVNGVVNLTCQTTACAADPAVLDLVGFGTGAAFEGTAAAPAPSATAAIYRAGNGCTDTNSNSSDFAVVAAPEFAPRNTTSPVNPCAAPAADPVITVNATPASALEGSPIIFLLDIAPLPAAGDSASFDVAVSGDPRAVYNGLPNITIDENTQSPLAISVDTVGNAINDGNGQVTLTLSNFVGTDATQVSPLIAQGTVIDDDIPFEAINAIQGSGQISPRNNQVVTTRGVVTGIAGVGFYIQTPDGDDDDNPLTSEGLYVYAGNAANMPAGLALGDLVFASGTITEYVPTADTRQLPITELVGPLTITTLSKNNPLPAPVVLTSASIDPDGALDQLESLEFMRVTVPDFTVTAPTEPSAPDLFFGVATGTPRPFREEGVDRHDCGANLPVEAVAASVPCWDANPELLRVKTNVLAGGAAIPLRSGTRLTNLTGVLDYAFRRYTILTRTAEAPAIVAGTEATGSMAAAPLTTEATIAGFNVENLSKPANPTATYIRKADKIVATIADYMHYPDIIGFIEVANQDTLTDIAQRISAAAVLNGDPDPLYSMQMASNSGTQRLGFLLKTAAVSGATPRVEFVDIEERGGGLRVICPDGISETIGLLNDRPPLIMNAIIHHANGQSYPLTVINNHLKSLIDVDSRDDAEASYACFNDPNIVGGGKGRGYRAKRQQNAEYTAKLVDLLQADSPGKPIVLVGDFNAFQFNDGYADLMNTILGTPPANDATVVPGDGIDLVDPDLVNLTELVTDEERYSYVFDGNAQVLDHILVNQAVIDTTTGFRRETPRVNADFTGADANSVANPFRNSDHDPAVGYLGISAFHTANLVLSSGADTTANVGEETTLEFSIENQGPDAAVNPRFTVTVPTGAGFQELTAPAGWDCDAPLQGESGLVDCVIATLASSADADFSLVILILPAASDSTLAFNAVATADSTDPVTPNLASINVEVAEQQFAPVFAEDTYAFNVNDNALTGAVVGQVTATDANANDVLTYSITAGDAGGAFAIDATGTITVANAGLLVGGNVFPLTVRVEDGTGLSDTTAVNVTVIELPDALFADGFED